MAEVQNLKQLAAAAGPFFDTGLQKLLEILGNALWPFFEDCSATGSNVA